MMMKRLILAILAACSSGQALGDNTACIWTGTYANCLPPAGVEIANGTVSLPALTFLSDPDSGLYRIGANDLGIAVNGALTLETTTTGIKSASLTFTDNTKGIVGTATNDSAGAGYVGQYIENFRTSNLNVGAALNHNFSVDKDATVSGTTTISQTGISLTAGDWDITCFVDFVLTSVTTFTSFDLWTGTTGGDTTTGRDLARGYAHWAGSLTGGEITAVTPAQRVSLSGSQDYFCQTSFTGTVTTTVNVKGGIRARRVR